MRSPAPTSPGAASPPSSRDPAQRTGRAGRLLYFGFCVRPSMARNAMTHSAHTHPTRLATGATPPLLSADSSLCLRHMAHPFCDALCKRNPPTLQASGTVISVSLFPPKRTRSTACFRHAFAPRDNAPETSSMTPRILSKFATVLYVLRRRPLPSTSHRKTTMLPPNIYSAFHALAIAVLVLSHSWGAGGSAARNSSLGYPNYHLFRLAFIGAAPRHFGATPTLRPSTLTPYAHTDTAPISILEILLATQVNHRTLRLCIKTAPRRHGACVPPLRSSSHLPCSAFFAVVFSCLLLPRSHPTPSHRPTALRDSVSGRVCHSLSITALLENQTCPLPPMLRYSFR
ncbi:hypothetical protein K438DRAFT_1972771 [Mycena galopus ATCC 62051]|nr:hypothetical protein K438DRAFT_1972771 [Mycena galopus ATCC 62051]